MRARLLIGCTVPLLALTACVGGGGDVASAPPPAPAPVPAPTPAPVPTPTPTPTPGTSFDTEEFRRSTVAIQAQAQSAYAAGATGQGVIAAVIDSGIDQNSAEFSGKILGTSADLAGSRGLQDPDGHGTAVASILAGAKNDVETHGVAFNARLLIARTDTPGSCTTTTGPDAGCSHADAAIARGVDLAIANGARVINMSLGGSPPNNALRAAMSRATAAGIVIVISAGNDGNNNPTLAANPDAFAQIAADASVSRGQVLIAGATTSGQTIAGFSNRAGTFGQYYITALGERVRAPGNNGTIFVWSGTSFSAPVISGAVALLAQAFPNLTGAQIVDLLLRTATDLGTAGTDGVYGRGELNLARAFAPQGQTSLEASRMAVSLADNAMLSAAMGDAGAKEGLSASIRDGYDRAYQVDLAPTLRRAPIMRHLTGALTDRSYWRGAPLGGHTSLAMAVADEQPGAMLLSAKQVRMARALAGSMVHRIDRRTTLALGAATGSAGLDAMLGVARQPAFLVADAGNGIHRTPTGAFAMRHSLRGLDVTLAAETGDVRSWEASPVLLRGGQERGTGYGEVTLGLDAGRGPVSVSARLSRMTERETVLGGRFSPALGGGGAASWFAELGIAARPAVGWSLAARVRRGWTEFGAGSVRAASIIQTQAVSLDATRTGLFTRHDSLSLRWAEPLRVTKGGLMLTGLGSDPAFLNLAPTGHERTLESVYAVRFGPGVVTLNGFWRQHPGNIAAASDDLGGALRYRFEF